MSEPAGKIKFLSSKSLNKVSLNYLGWNDQIAKHFFNTEQAGTRVWFSVEQELINEIAKKNNVNPDHFIKSVKNGPDWINRPNQTICSKASAVFKNWRESDKNFDYPPYIAYLALFVLAVNYGDSDDFSESNYYGRLKDILDEHISTNHFKPMLDLWDDLESWSQADKKGAWGDFYNDTDGKNFYVGIPQYQVVLRTEDRQKLPEIFFKMGWDSDSLPTEEEILKALKSNQSLLSNRTAKRIDTGKPDFLLILTDRVLEELKDYDEHEEQIDNDQESSKKGFIVICLNIDETAQRAEFYFRCKRKSGLPKESFILKRNNSEWKIIPSSSSMSKKINNFNILNWENDFHVQAGKIKFNYKGSKHKIFTPANKLGISGWISDQRYEPKESFYLMVHNSLSDKVQKWGDSECDQCQKLDFKGVPEQWDLFKIKGVNGDTGIKKDIRALSIDTKLRIRFTGGIHLSKGNKFFNFAPPKILITGQKTKVPTPKCIISNQPEASLKEHKNIFYLPKNIPCGEKIKIEIPKNEQSECIKKSFMLIKNRLKKFSDYTNSYVMDNFGNFIQLQKEYDEFINSKKSYFIGAYCHDLKSGNYPRLLPIPLDDAKKFYLLGCIPGQIVLWSKESWPEWNPVWMIQFKTRKKATADLIGDLTIQHQPAKKGAQHFSKEKIKLWKKISWHLRKRITTNSKKQWRVWTKRAEYV